jgi:hypothetical protein
VTAAARRVATIVAGLSILVMAACGSAPAVPLVVDQADPRMGHQPLGTVELLTDPDGTSLRYAVHGLQPSSVHPLEVGQAGCGSPPMPVGLLRADAAGTATGDLRVALPGRPGALDGSLLSWGISVAVGPGSQAPAELSPLACAAVTGGARTELAPAAAYAATAATVHISYDRATRVMTVRVRASGLEPGTRHPNHLHVGQCLNEGPVREVLNVLVADATGKAEATTEIPQSDGIKYGERYVAIHHGPGLDDQGQYALLTCGDVLNAGAATP